MLLRVHPFEHVRYKQKEDSLVKTLIHITTSSQKLKGYHAHSLDQSSYNWPKTDPLAGWKKREVQIYSNSRNIFSHLQPVSLCSPAVLNYKKINSFYFVHFVKSVIICQTLKSDMVDPSRPLEVAASISIRAISLTPPSHFKKRFRSGAS